MNNNKCIKPYVSNVISNTVEKIENVSHLPKRGYVDVSDQVLVQVYLDAYNDNACPIIIHRFKSYLQGYSSHLYDEVVDIVQNGAHIPSEIVFIPNTPVPQNQKSTIEYKEKVNEMILKELSSRRIAGPFLKAPPGLIIFH